MDLLAVLPAELAALVFLRVPAADRLRCLEVSRGWLSFLDHDVHNWTVCDLSGGGTRHSKALLLAATARAKGKLRELDVSGWPFSFGTEAEAEAEAEAEEVVEAEDRASALLPTLFAVLRSNAGSLLLLRCFGLTSFGRVSAPPLRLQPVSSRAVTSLLTAAPLLRVLECDLQVRDCVGEVTPDGVPRVLVEPPFAPLRLQSLFLIDHQYDFVAAAHGMLQPRMQHNVPATLSRASFHSSLVRLSLYHFALTDEATLGAVVNLAISQLHYLELEQCTLSPAMVPALAQILQRGSLKGLRVFFPTPSEPPYILAVDWHGSPIIIGDAVPFFCEALRASRLVELELCGMGLWNSLDDGLAIISACVGHPTLRLCNFSHNRLNDTIRDMLDVMRAEAAAGFRLYTVV